MVLVEYNDSGRDTKDMNSIIKAKVVLLGDPETGKTTLVHNLMSVGGTHELSSSEIRSDSFFSVIEFSPSELGNSDNGVFLKIWEHPISVSSQEEELACRGALICIITLDICSPETANNAFNKWLLLKQSFMSECFLFVIGTGLDRSLHRRVQIKDVCRACAQKDATYLEVSNVDNNNIALLRRLIAQRLIYMLKRRELITAQNEPLSSSSIDLNDKQMHLEKEPGDDNDDDSDVDDAEVHPHQQIQLANNTLMVPLMEQNILSDSVGSILSSYLGSDAWPGFEAEEQRLIALGTQLSSFIDQLSRDRSIDITSSVGHIDLSNHSLTIDESNYQFEAQKIGNVKKTKSSTQGEMDIHEEENDFVDSAYSMSELKTAFEIMGLSLPKSLSSAAAAVESNSLLNEIDDELANTPKKISYLRKMIVRLPDGTTADMVLDLESNIEQQIELFLLSNTSISDDNDARSKLVHILHQIREEYYISSGHSNNSPTNKSALHDGEFDNGELNISLLNSPPPPPPSDGKDAVITEEAKAEIRRKLSTVNIQPFARFKATKKCKLRIVLAGSTASMIEVVIQKGEDLIDIAESIKTEYRLSNEMKQKVYEQLLDAFEL